MIGPIFLLLVIMFGYPLIKSVVMAFQNYKLGNANVYFNDFANFHKMFGDKDFLLLLKNICSLCSRFRFRAVYRRPDPCVYVCEINSKEEGIYQSIVFRSMGFLGIRSRSCSPLVIQRRIWCCQ